MTTTSIDFTYEENYPLIRVYKNLLNDAKETLMAFLGRSADRQVGGYLYSEWTEWFLFGKYASAKTGDLTGLKLDINKECNEELHIYRTLQDATRVAMSHYIADKKVPLPPNSFLTVPSISYYYPEVEINKELKYTMNYHTDFNTGEYFWPADKFLLTCTVYPNDNYDGGEIIFCVDKKQITYKPEAGDIIVFPSGNPIWPSNEPYFHAVNKVTNGTKYLCRAYTKYQYPTVTEKWQKGLDEHGEKWPEIARKQASGLNILSVHEQINEKNEKVMEFHVSEEIARIYNMPSTKYSTGLEQIKWK